MKKMFFAGTVAFSLLTGIILGARLQYNKFGPYDYDSASQKYADLVDYHFIPGAETNYFLENFQGKVAKELQKLEDDRLIDGYTGGVGIVFKKDRSWILRDPGEISFWIKYHFMVGDKYVEGNPGYLTSVYFPEELESLIDLADLSEAFDKAMNKSKTGVSNEELDKLIDHYLVPQAKNYFSTVRTQILEYCKNNPDKCKK